MARRSKRKNTALLHAELVALLRDFRNRLDDGTLREQVLALVPAMHVLRDLGSSLLGGSDARSARLRILLYFQRYPGIVISSDELAVISGISEYARRARELKTELGWPIYSGSSVRAMAEEDGDGSLESVQANLFAPYVNMKVDEYVLLGEQDREAAHRWNLAKTARRLEGSIRDRMLYFLQENIEKPVSGDELQYVANGAQSWPRRVRELRTEHGWPIATRLSGRPDLPVGYYVLESDRQAEPHDRKIPDGVRVEVLERDGFRCRCCGWSKRQANRADPRTSLELHHVHPHADGGANSADNLIALCNVHHDVVHARSIDTSEALRGWLKESCPS